MMKREGWDLSGRAAIRLDGLMVGTSDGELFNVPLLKLPTLCSWAVTFPLCSWRGDLESMPLQAHTLDAALDEVEALYPLASWWWAARGQITPAEAAYVLSAEEAPPGASDIERDVWWIVGKLPVTVTAHEGGLLVQVQHGACSDWLRVVRSENTIVVGSDRRGSSRKAERRISPVSWGWENPGEIWAPFDGDYAALQALLKRHPAPVRPL